MNHFRRVVFTISKEHDIYIDEVLLDDKRKDKKEFPNGRSEYIRKLINDDMNKDNKVFTAPYDPNDFIKITKVK